MNAEMDFRPTHVDPLDVFRLYLSLKQHFSQDNYDYFKFNGRIKSANAYTFNKRRDKAFFSVLGKKYQYNDLVEFFVANFLYNETIWVGDMLDMRCVRVYTNWKKRTDSLTYNFNQELELLLNRGKLENLFSAFNGEHPMVMTMMTHGDISVETFCVLAECFRMWPRWDKTIEDEIVYPNIRRKCTKYLPFLKVNINKFRVSIKERLTRNNSLQERV